jgi:hypothetical protein
MPLISVFFGISIKMYFNDHGPPHFHAQYQGKSGFFSIESGKYISGNLPSRAIELVTKWAISNKTALKENWNRARSNNPLFWIEGADK